jgi:hypothetical protein
MAKQCRDSGRQAGDIPFLGGIITCSSGFSTSSGELAVNVLGGSKAHARDIARTKPRSAVSMTALSPAQLFILLPAPYTVSYSPSQSAR